MTRTRARRHTRRLGAVVSFVLVATALVGVGPGSPTGAASPRLPVAAGVIRPAARCPWVQQSLRHRASASTLADEVVARMTLAQKVSFIALSTYPPLENANVGIPNLCIPPLTLTDGPNGVANGLQFVTQLPAAIGVGATFDPSLAGAVAGVLASEARAKGIDGVQAPNLNLARVPLSGRIFETYGEDPELSAVLGVAAIRAIQSRGEIADAKHFTAYTQETARARLNQQVSARALAEIYNAPFEAAVRQAHVASLMCSYGSLNGVNTCSNPYVYRTLHQWGFTGFVRSDLGAVPDPVAALRAGIAMLKPISTAGLIGAVLHHRLAMRALDRAVHSVLVPMFALGLVAHPLRLELGAHVSTPSHVAVALRAAESSIVLLKNHRRILPLPGTTRSIAVIGLAGNQDPMSAGGGSAAVVASNVVTPLAALRHAMAGRVRLTYAPGDIYIPNVKSRRDIVIESGTPLKLITRFSQVGEPGKADIGIDRGGNVSPSVATAATPGTGDNWMTSQVRFRAKRTGIYDVAFRQFGDTWVYINGRLLIASRGLHSPDLITTAVRLLSGRDYTLRVTWFDIRDHPAPTFDLVDASPAIAKAVRLARRAQYAIVFASAPTSEGADRPNLNLPGDQNSLIQAVAAANRHTIVVLETGGAVAMPWIGRVAAVLEAWFPGQVDGAAIAPVLTGAVDPSGHLPLTFPTAAEFAASASPHLYPGVDGTVSFSPGLQMGYRWYQANNVRPLFPFGFGLSYTTFALGHARLRRTGTGVSVTLRVANTGHRTGAAVIQLYVAYPAGAGEPPHQLRAFSRVLLRAGETTRVTMAVDRRGFSIYRHGSFTVVPGTYHLDIGQSSANLPIRLSARL